jgi:uncharacterized protein YqeY
LTVKEQISSDVKDAMRAKDSAKLGALRMLQSEIKKREIDSRTEMQDADVFKAIQTMLKQRNDSIEQFKKGNRPDLAEKEQLEVDILKKYLPAGMSAAEVEALVVAAIAESGAATPNDIGKVMKIALAKAGGRADGKIINELARAKLSKS